MLSQNLAAISLNSDLKYGVCHQLPDFFQEEYDSAGRILDLELQLHTPAKVVSHYPQSLDDLLWMAAMDCPDRILRSYM